MAKKDPIEFWFDFSSPYSYIAATQIDELAADYGRTVRWRPFLLGPVFKQTGNVPLLDQPLKGDYLRHDVPRFARLYGISYRLPDPFPIAALAPARAFYWIEKDDPARAKRFAEAAFERYYVDGKDISQPDETADVAARLDVNPGDLLDAIQSPEIKDTLKAACTEAVERGICGAPFFFVDGEPFWGADRLWMVEEWLDTGGW